MSYVTNLPYEGRFKITQTAGGSYSHKYVSALDMVGLDSKSVYSIIDGTIGYAGFDTGGFGNYVRIDGVDGNRYYFAHLSQIKVSKGQKVNRATVLGVEGSTGNSTGSHCHVEIRKGSSGFTQISVPAYMGLPNKLGTYNSANYRIYSTSTSTSTKTKNIKTVNCIALQLLNAPAGRRICNLPRGTKVEILDNNCGSYFGFVRSKVRVVSTSKIGYVAKYFLK